MEEAHVSFGDLLKRSEVLDAIAKKLCDYVAKIEVVEEGPDYGHSRFRCGVREPAQYNIPWAWPIRHIQKIEVSPALDGDAFTFFSGEEYSSHPWHQHSQLIQDIISNTNEAIASLHTFCEESFTFYDCSRSFQVFYGNIEHGGHCASILPSGIW